MPKVVIMIPALLGSTRIKDKNIFLVNGYPMMFYVVKAAKESKYADNIYINAEDKIFKRMAEMLNVEFYQRKPDKGGSECTMKNKSRDCSGRRCQVHDHFIYDFLKEIDTDYLIQVHTTSPLITSETISNFIESLIENEYDSQFATIDIHEESLLGETPINFSYTIKKMTQALDPLKSLSWAISGWKADSFISSYEENDIDVAGPTFCGKVGFFPISKIEGLDADTPDDLFIIESVLAHKKRKSNFLKHKFTDRVVEIDDDLKRLIYRDGVENVPELVENNDTIFTISIDDIKDKMSGNSWIYPLFYNINDQICLIKQNKSEGCRKHYHATKGEWWFVLEGTFKWVMDDGEEHIVGKNEIIYLPPATIHQIFCISEEPGIRMAGGAKDMEHVYIDE